MNTSFRSHAFIRHILPLALSAAAFAVSSSPAFAEDATTAKEINPQISKLTAKIDTLTEYGQLLDPAHRDSIKDKLLPLLKQREDLYTKLVAVAPAAKTNTRHLLASNEAMLAACGATSAGDALAAQSAAKNPAEAAAAKAALLLVRWWDAAEKPAEQKKILDEIETLAKEQPKDDDIALIVKLMIDANAANAELQAKGSDIIAAMKSPWAVHYAKFPNQLGKPLAITGDDQNGKPFDSANWKGKVVLVQFWASWCPPCVEDEPAVEKIYEGSHPKGLEIVGVSSDLKLSALETFEKKHPAMTWPQLYVTEDKLVEKFHPLMRQFDLSGVPTAFLIDRHGLLRSDRAREQMNELAPKLLAENP